MSLLSRIRRILGNERETPGHNDARQTPDTKVAVAAIPASAPKPAYTDSARNPNMPDRAAWARLNQPDFTRHSFRVVRCGRGRDGRPILFETDVRTGRRIDESERSPFALEQPKK